VVQPLEQKVGLESRVVAAGLPSLSKGVDHPEG